jgi:hypothetical protein
LAHLRRDVRVYNDDLSNRARASALQFLGNACDAADSLGGAFDSTFPAMVGDRPRERNETVLCRDGNDRLVDTGVQGELIDDVHAQPKIRFNRSGPVSRRMVAILIDGCEDTMKPAFTTTL